LDFKEIIPANIYPKNYDEPSENEERMFEAFRTLNEAERAIIALFLEDYSYKEIAQITGATENNVGVKISRIKEKLKKILN
jgi:RNA polymerase sigma-70 factor (ECF subfamily)